VVGKMKEAKPHNEQIHVIAVPMYHSEIERIADYLF